MGAPIFIDSLALTLGRFLRNRDQERTVSVGRQVVYPLPRLYIPPTIPAF